MVCTQNVLHSVVPWRRTSLPWGKWWCQSVPHICRGQRKGGLACEWGAGVPGDEALLQNEHLPKDACHVCFTCLSFCKLSCLALFYATHCWWVWWSLFMPRSSLFKSSAFDDVCLCHVVVLFVLYLVWLTFSGHCIKMHRWASILINYLQLFKLY